MHGVLIKVHSIYYCLINQKDIPKFQTDTGHLYNVTSTSMQCHDVESTLRQRFINIMCKLGYPDFEGWAQDYGDSNIFLKPLFRGNLDPFVNNANLGAIAHTSNGT